MRSAVQSAGRTTLALHFRGSGCTSIFDEKRELQLSPESTRIPQSAESGDVKRDVKHSRTTIGQPSQKSKMKAV
jgi:hypothetical protein